MPYYVYILTNKLNTVLYTGVTNDLSRRMYEHKNHLNPGFTDKYNVTKLVFCQTFSSVEEAISAEKTIKGWTRAKKNALVESINPGWRDLTEEY